MHDDSKEERLLRRNEDHQSSDDGGLVTSKKNSDQSFEQASRLFSKSFSGASYGLWALDIGIFILLVSGLVFFIVQGATSSGYGWQWYRVWRFVVELSPASNGQLWSMGLLLQGLVLTLKVSSISLIFAFLLSICTVFMQRSGSMVARGLAFCYIEAIRNTPLLIQLFLAYFVLAPVLDMGRFSTAILALSLFEGAYMAEILRAALDAVPQGQWEASRSLGMDDRGTMWQVVVPQALRRAVPPLTGQAVSLVKDSSLVSVIALHDLTMNAQMIIAETFLTFEVWLVTAALYLAVTALMSGLVFFIERRLHFEH